MRLTIRMRLMLAFGIMILALVGLGVYSIYSLNTVNEQSNIINDKWLPGLNHANQISILASEHRIREYRHIIETDTAQLEQMEKEMTAFQKEIDEIVARYETIDNGNEDNALVTSFKTYWGEYLTMNDRVIAFSRNQDPGSAMAIMRGDSKKTFDDANNRLLEIVAFNEHNSAQAALAGDRIYDNSIKILTLVIGIVTVLAIGVALVITNGIIKPIKNLSASADRIAQGDLDIEVNTSGKDEIGNLASSFATMAKSINETLININSASEQVASGSKQVSDSSIALSQGATEQASSIEQLTASIEEIASQTRFNAENASQANVLAETAQVNATVGNEQMKQMLKAMDEINDASSRISKIIKVIDEIAFQTNILALNAAVEAARAGQHGKGFAVVAEEVRNLAARSANAAKETTDMIEGSIKKVEGGTRIANETAQALNSIVESISKVAHLVGDIATASTEQASGIDQINQGIMQVSQVVQTNSATSEESAAASEELSSQADMLKGQVMKFNLKKVRHSDYSTMGMNDVNPEVLRMLENMAESRNGHTPRAGAKSKVSKKISLNDLDFGKY